MTPRLFRLVLIVVVVLLGASACGSGQAALEVGDTTITRSDLLDALDEQGVLVDGVAPSAAAARYLTDQARLLLVQEAVDAAGLDVTVDLSTMEQAFQSIVVAEIESRVPDIRETAASGIECSRHILVATEAEALDLLDQLDTGGDFAALAREFSTDPGSGVLGGDLGCVAVGSFVPEFEAALAAAGVNEVVGPVETQFGFHLIEKLPTVVDDVAVFNAGLNLAFEGDEDFRAWRDGVMGAEVTVDSRYGEWDEALLQVVPSQAAGG